MKLTGVTDKSFAKHMNPNHPKPPMEKPGSSEGSSSHRQELDKTAVSQPAIFVASMVRTQERGSVTFLQVSFVLGLLEIWLI